MTECLVCEAATVDVWLCGTHVGMLRRMLFRLPHLAAELATTRARLDCMVRNVGSSSKGGPPPGIVNFDAAAVLAELRKITAKWSTALHTSMAELITEQSVGFLYDDIREISRRAELAVDLPPSREGYDYAGPCGAVFDNGTCTHELWVRHRAQSVSCPRCGTVWDVGPRRAGALAAAAELMATADAISRALTSAGQAVTANMIYQWKSRRQLTPAGMNKAGQPLYRVGDVITILEARK